MVIAFYERFSKLRRLSMGGSRGAGGAGQEIKKYILSMVIMDVGMQEALRKYVLKCFKSRGIFFIEGFQRCTLQSTSAVNLKI